MVVPVVVVNFDVSAAVVVVVTDSVNSAVVVSAVVEAAVSVLLSLTAVFSFSAVPEFPQPVRFNSIAQQMTVVRVLGRFCIFAFQLLILLFWFAYCFPLIYQPLNTPRGICRAC